MPELKGFTDQELKAELSRRADLERQMILDLRREEQRIYNLPENVEKRQAEHRANNYQRILDRTRERHPMLSENTRGKWKIFGEDPNCDMGGSHHEPYLETVEGTLKDAVMYAIELKGFWNWGGGGRLELAEDEKVKKL